MKKCDYKHSLEGRFFHLINIPCFKLVDFSYNFVFKRTTQLAYVVFVPCVYVCECLERGRDIYTNHTKVHL